ncbi:MAG TPA: SusC/RagA family TonB-linked outer membrane protein [Gemmatimonadaceae bacterium]|nr:SusC/RagA family TonB-linked outer membrane protein [Gemmatimonadaceae bacterium]
MSRNSHAAFAVAALLLGAIPTLAAAQQGTTISGRVTSESAAPLPSVSVSIPSMSAGALTDANGRYSFTLPGNRIAGQTVTLTARRIGFEPKSTTIRLAGTSITHDFMLSAAAMELQGIVVTALGQEKEKSQLGTAVQTVSNSDLTQTKAQSIVDQLEGKVAGVQITGTGTPGGSSYISIRGANSITGDNTPLFIVDGVPVSHIDHGASANGGWDFGSAINDINQDDIESMTVLKGPNAAALYGSRAANGVILITTKTGRNSGGRMRVDANSFYTWDNPSRLPTYQNQYGQGAGGEFLYVDGLGDGVNDGADQSWGPQLDGRTSGCIFKPKTTTYDTSVPCKQFDAVDGGPWVAHPDNVASFFQTAHTASATIAVSGGTDRANARLSAGTDNNSSIIPGTYLQKTNALLTGTLQVTDRLSADATVNYIRNGGRNRPGQGYSNSILESFVWFGRQVNLSELKQNWQASSALNNGPDGREYNWNYDFHNNPYFLMYGNPENDTRDRLLGNVSATYKITDWLNLTGRTGSDWYRLNIAQDWSPADITGAPVNPSYNGGFALSNEYNNETNSEALLTANKTYNKLALNGTFGGNIRKETYNWTQVSTQGISAPGIYNVSNAAIALANSQTDRRRQVNSAYGSASFTYNSWWTVEGTARNDWSSTLPKGQNSYFYPSVNTSLVLSDLFPSIANHGISYFKLRGALAQVGNDASPYQLRTVYTGVSSQFKGQPQFTLSDQIANASLKPELTRSSEGGVEIAFLHGRVDLDASYYDKNTRNQIFPVSISSATGFGAVVINAGRVKNEGAEAQLTVQALQMSNGFNWTTGFNFAKNASRVVTLYPGISRIRLGNTWGVDVEAREGEPYGTLFGTAFARDSATGLILTDGGLPQAGSKKVMGNFQPEWVGAWNNSFVWKNWSLSGLIDIHKGGNIFSVTNQWGEYAGVLANSLQGREVDWNKPGVVVHGIDVNTGKLNTDTVTSEEYFQNIYPSVDPYIYNDTWVKLREVRLGYELSPRLANRLHANSMNIAIVGRNLHTWTKVPNIDPEVAYSQDPGNQGQEYGSIPSARSIGVSVRVTP